jgi:hypothetical protein
MDTITVCASVSFYKEVIEVKGRLEKQGYKVLVPKIAEQMAKLNDYEVSHYKTWFEDKDDYHKKTSLIRGHFNAVEKGDSILVLNLQKHGVDNYIGGNVLMEMALAFYLKKPIFIFNEIPEESTFLEEIIGMEPIVLHGKLDKISKKT